MNRSSPCPGLAACLLLAMLPNLVRADTVIVAVAANFVAPLEELAALFEGETGHTVTVSPGSSGRLYAQIVNGAPYQVFLSADQDKPKTLVENNLADASSQFTYATGALVLWTPVKGLPVQDAQVLQGAGVARLAIANPRLAPYGAAAVQVLESLGLVEIYRDRLVLGENINQAFQFTDTGNAGVGLVALSQVMKNGSIDRGSGWVVPQDLYDPIRQDAVVTRKGEGVAAVSDFVTFLKSERARAIINSFGYGTD